MGFALRIYEYTNGLHSTNIGLFVIRRFVPAGIRIFVTFKHPRVFPGVYIFPGV